MTKIPLFKRNFHLHINFRNLQIISIRIFNPLSIIFGTTWALSFCKSYNLGSWWVRHLKIHKTTESPVVNKYIEFPCWRFSYYISATSYIVWLAFYILNILYTVNNKASVITDKSSLSCVKQHHQLIIQSENSVWWSLHQSISAHKLSWWLETALLSIFRASITALIRQQEVVWDRVVFFKAKLCWIRVLAIL